MALFLRRENLNRLLSKKKNRKQTEFFQQNDFIFTSTQSCFRTISLNYCCPAFTIFFCMPSLWSREWEHYEVHKLIEFPRWFVSRYGQSLRSISGLMYAHLHSKKVAFNHRRGHSFCGTTKKTFSTRLAMTK